MRLLNFFLLPLYLRFLGVGCALYLLVGFLSSSILLANIPQNFCKSNVILWLLLWLLVSLFCWYFNFSFSSSLSLVAAWMFLLYWFFNFSFSPSLCLTVAWLFLVIFFKMVPHQNISQLSPTFLRWYSRRILMRPWWYMVFSINWIFLWTFPEIFLRLLSKK